MSENQYHDGDLKYALAFDKRGNFVKMEQVQYLEGGWLIPADGSTVFLEKFKDTFDIKELGYDTENNYYTLNESKTDLVGNAYPVTAAACVGIFIEHEDNSDFACKMRELFDDLCSKDSNYRVISDTELCKTVEKVPEKTPGEVAAEKAEQDRVSFDETLKELKDAMALAMLNNDQETIKELQTEYQALMASTSV